MPDISVIFPSRGRGASLRQTLGTLRMLADQPRRTEFLVACDPDDPWTRHSAWASLARTWVMPERYGYPGMHRYYNELLPHAEGTWLMLWGDDAKMITHGWDSVIRNQPLGVLWPLANHAQHANCFPVWPRAWSLALGHVSLSPHPDTYWQRIGEALDCHRKIPVEILHDRCDVTGGHDDATYREGRWLLGPEGMVPGGIPSEEDVETAAAVIRGLR